MTIATLIADAEVPNRFWKKVAAGDNECLIWTAALDDNGYGLFQRASDEGRGVTRAYSWLWKRVYGPVPKGLELDHTCATPRCVNPLHLEAVTHRENMVRGHRNACANNARRSHCKHGHPLVPNPTRPGHRHCPICKRESRPGFSEERGLEYAAIEAGERLCQRDGCHNEVPRSKRAGTKWCSSYCQIRSWKDGRQ